MEQGGKTYMILPVKEYSGKKYVILGQRQGMTQSVFACIYGGFN